MSLLYDLLGFKPISDEEIKKAKLLDCHRYTENNMVYEQKVYRLDDNSIYTNTKTLVDQDEEFKKQIQEIKKQLQLAIKEERFEDAAPLRDKLRVMYSKNA